VVHAAQPHRPVLVRLLLNVVWLVLAGFWMAVAYAVVGLVLCCLVVTIPFGVQVLKIAGYALWPFGRTVVLSERHSAVSTLGNVVWFVLAGWWLALGHLVAAVLLAITIIGLPLAAGQLKLVPISINPFGREVVSADLAR
jgi:uncharacterized membrane protein YccF (DUF307 family)